MATLPEGHVGVRGSKDQDGPVLVFTPPRVGRLHRRRQGRRVRPLTHHGEGKTAHLSWLGPPARRRAASVS
ncbi:DUF397 domain-containing protein [Microtetraspora fusca]|uniref:DUF397 domain-containing protein n=1 Tax=Microtetraspora fusca TaxID=1997 RepID=A0ABW6VAY1_MICFU